MEQSEILGKLEVDAKAALKELLLKEVKEGGVVDLELDKVAALLGSLGPVVIAAVKPLLLPLLQAAVEKI